MSRNEPYHQIIFHDCNHRVATCEARNGPVEMAQNAIQPFAYFIWIHWNNCPEINANDGQLQSCVALNSKLFFGSGFGGILVRRIGSFRVQYNLLCCVVSLKDTLSLSSLILSLSSWNCFIAKTSICAHWLACRDGVH